MTKAECPVKFSMEEEINQYHYHTHSNSDIAYNAHCLNVTCKNGGFNYHPFA